MRKTSSIMTALALAGGALALMPTVLAGDFGACSFGQDENYCNPECNLWVPGAARAVFVGFGVGDAMQTEGHCGILELIFDPGTSSERIINQPCGDRPATGCSC